MENATIIQLVPHKDSAEAVSFEQAFGQHSEARGKRAARKASRATKKAAKKKTSGNRLGRLALGIATGGLVGGVIKTGPQARADRQARKLERISRRGEAKAARQSNRAAQQEARQTRKDIRKTRKVARKELAPEEAPEIIDEEQDYPSEPEAEYEEPEYEEEAEEPEYEEEAEEPEYEEPEYEEEEGEYQESFNGEFAHSAAGMPEIHSEIRGITEKIVWNKEAMRRRKGDKGKLVNETKNLVKTNRNGRDVSKNSGVIQDHDMVIQKHEARIKELELGLKKFGPHPHIPEGYRQAQSKLQKGVEKKGVARDKARIKETLVASNLNPEISKQRIEVPSTPCMKKVEMSSFSGPTLKGMSTQTKWLLAIAALGVAVVVAKKYKYI